MPTSTITVTYSDSPTPTFTNSPTATPTYSNSPTQTSTFSASPTLSGTPTTTPTATITVTLTVTPSNTPMGMWLGNSDQGQGHDYTGNGYDGTNVGACSNPESPAPPEGDRWLAGGFGATGLPENYMSVPVAALNRYSGYVEFYANENNPSGLSEVVWGVKDSTGNLLATLRVDSARESVTFNSFVPGFNYLSPAGSFPNNANNLLRLDWNANGTSLRINGVLQGSSTTAPNFSSAAQVVFGSLGRNPSNYYFRGLIDAAKLGSDGVAVMAVPTGTPTRTVTRTMTSTRTVTVTRTPTVSRTSSSTATVTPTSSPTATESPVSTESNTPTASFSASPTRTMSNTRSATATKTVTLTRTATTSKTFSEVPSASLTRTTTSTPSATRTVTETWSSTPSITETSVSTDTFSITPTRTPTFTRSATSTKTVTLTKTVSPLPTASLTKTISPVPTASATKTITETRTITLTKTISQTRTFTESKTATLTRTETLTRTTTPTATVTRTVTETRTPVNTAVNSATPTPMVGTPTATSTQTPGALGLLSPHTGVLGATTDYSYTLNLNAQTFVSGFCITLTAGSFELLGNAGLSEDDSEVIVDTYSNSIVVRFASERNKFSTGAVIAVTFTARALGAGNYTWGAFLNNNPQHRVKAQGISGYTVVVTAPSPTSTWTPGDGGEDPLHVGPGSVKSGLDDPLGQLLSAQKPLIVFPNPARGRAKAGFYLKTPGSVRVILASLSGEIVGTLSLGERPAGIGTGDLDLSGFASGLYVAILQVDSDNGWQTKSSFKLAIVR